MRNTSKKDDDQDDSTQSSPIANDWNEFVDTCDYESLLRPVVTESSNGHESHLTTQTSVGSGFLLAHTVSCNGQGRQIDPYTFIRGNPGQRLKDKANEQLDMCVHNRKKVEDKRNKYAAIMAEKNTSLMADTRWNEDLEKWKNKRKLRQSKTIPDDHSQLNISSFVQKSISASYDTPSTQKKESREHYGPIKTSSSIHGNETDCIKGPSSSSSSSLTDNERKFKTLQQLRKNPSSADAKVKVVSSDADDSCMEYENKEKKGSVSDGIETKNTSENERSAVIEKSKAIVSQKLTNVKEKSLEYDKLHSKKMGGTVNINSPKRSKTKININIEKDKDSDSFGIEIGVRKNDIGVQTFYIKDVDEGSLADHAGIRKNDEIVEISGRYTKTSSRNDVMNLMNECRTHGKLKMMLMRNETNRLNESVEIENPLNQEAEDISSKKHSIDSSSYSVSKIREKIEQQSIDSAFANRKGKEMAAKCDEQKGANVAAEIPKKSGEGISEKSGFDGSSKRELKSDQSKNIKAKSEQKDGQLSDSNILAHFQRDKMSTSPAAVRRKMEDEKSNEFGEVYEEASKDARPKQETYEQKTQIERKSNVNRTTRPDALPSFSKSAKSSSAFHDKKNDDDDDENLKVKKDDGDDAFGRDHVRNEESSPNLANQTRSDAKKQAHTFRNGSGSKFEQPTTFKGYDDNAYKRELSTIQKSECQPRPATLMNKSKVSSLKNAFEPSTIHHGPSLSVSFDGKKLDRLRHLDLEEYKSEKEEQFHTQPPTSTVVLNDETFTTTKHLNSGKRADHKDFCSIQPQPKSQQHVPPIVDRKEMCAGCGKRLGGGSAMIIPNLHLYYHTECFCCCRCGTEIAAALDEIDVFIKENRLCCESCFFCAHRQKHCE